MDDQNTNTKGDGSSKIRNRKKILDFLKKSCNSLHKILYIYIIEINLYININQEKI